MERLAVIDSHTGGEPTRTVISGGPDVGTGNIGQKLARLRQHDWLRTTVVNEPRGSDVLVGALLTPTEQPGCDFGLIFFNNVGYLGMCGHGTIGVVATLAHMGKITPGVVTFETPVGMVSAVLHESGEVTLTNVTSYRTVKDLSITVDGHGVVKGDLAWGGNWFYLVKATEIPLELANVERLIDFTWKIRQAINSQGYPEVDHIELFGPGVHGNAKNFVLCPGKAYDRSPCGTGTSAKLACLAADGILAENTPWVQESIIGSQFTGSFVWEKQASQPLAIRPSITGIAYVMAEATLLVDPADPFKHGI